MSLKDLARAALAKSCPSVPVPSRGTVGHQGRTDAHTISERDKPIASRNTASPAGTIGTLGTNGTVGTTGTGVTRQPVFETLPPSPEPDAYTLAEREALAADRCPPVFLTAWARLQLVRPRWALEGEWREAIDGAGRFLDQWGDDAVAIGWPADEIFDRHGLAFALMGANVRALGPHHADLDDGRRFMRRY